MYNNSLRFASQNGGDLHVRDEEALRIASVNELLKSYVI
jgi:hypothetical protein